MVAQQHPRVDALVFLRWCAEHGLDPLAAQRPQAELYLEVHLS
jgi:hypothetical protein